MGSLDRIEIVLKSTVTGKNLVITFRVWSYFRKKLPTVVTGLLRDEAGPISVLSDCFGSE